MFALLMANLSSIPGTPDDRDDPRIIPEHTKIINETETKQKSTIRPKIATRVV